MDLLARVTRHPIPGETVPGTDLLQLPGGKGANQAVAAASAGATALMAARVGDDSAGQELRAVLSSRGVDVAHVGISSGPTGTALIVVNAEGENTIVVVPGANGALRQEQLQQLSPVAGDVLVAQFEVPLPTVEAFLRLGRTSKATTIVNPAPALREGAPLLQLADVVVVNQTELAVLLDIPLPEGDAAVAMAARRIRGNEDQVVVVTLGASGLLAVNGVDDIRVDGRPVPVVDTTGAGDCFVGALAARLAAGDELMEALRFANAAASLSVQHPGAGSSMPSMDEVVALL